PCRGVAAACTTPSPRRRANARRASDRGALRLLQGSTRRPRPASPLREGLSDCRTRFAASPLLGRGRVVVVRVAVAVAAAALCASPIGARVAVARRRVTVLRERSGGASRLEELGERDERVEVARTE